MGFRILSLGCRVKVRLPEPCLPAVPAPASPTATSGAVSVGRRPATACSATSWSSTAASASGQCVVLAQTSSIHIYVPYLQAAAGAHRGAAAAQGGRAGRGGGRAPRRRHHQRPRGPQRLGSSCTGSRKYPCVQRPGGGGPVWRRRRDAGSRYGARGPGVCGRHCGSRSASGCCVHMLVLAMASLLLTMEDGHTATDYELLMT